MPEVSFITHKGVRILYENFENAQRDEIIAWIEKTKAIIRSQPKKSVLGLVNVKGAAFDMLVTGALKEFVKGNEPYMISAAVYGVEGLKEVVFGSVLTVSGRKNLVLCKTLEEGKEFLVKQARTQKAES